MEQRYYATSFLALNVDLFIYLFVFQKVLCYLAELDH